MADLNAGKDPNRGSTENESGLEETPITLQPVSALRNVSGPSTSRRPKRLKKEWPPRSPPPSPLSKAKRLKKGGSVEDSDDIKHEVHITIEEDGDGVNIECIEPEEPCDEIPKDTSGKAVPVAAPKTTGRRFRSKGQLWKHLCSLPSEAVFQKWKQESEQKISPIPARWAKKRLTETKCGIKQYYHCGVLGCKAELAALYPSHCEAVEVSQNGKPHLHQSNPRRWGLSRETKQEVKRLWESGLQKPRLIKAALDKVGLGDCTINQLVNFLERVKKHTNASTPTLSFNDLQEWCTEHSISQQTDAPDDDIDRAYVFDRDIDAKTRQFRVSLSSKRLMKIAAQASTVVLDASQRMKWFDASVLFVGINDAGGVFFPIMFAVISQETTATFLKLLNVLKQCVEASSGLEFKPKCVIGNGDPLLTEAVKSAFPDAVVRMCWLQVKKGLNALLKPVGKELRDTLEMDVNALRLSCDQTQFKLGAKLMLEKWRRLLPSSDIPDKFEERFVNLHSDWYEGFDVTSHSSNRNLMLAVNAVKNRHTLRECLPVERYLTLSLELVLEWSVGVSEVGEPQSNIVADKALLNDTCQLQTEERTMVNLDSAIYVTAGDRTVATVEEVDAFEKKMTGDVSSFDEFVEARMSLWKVVDLGNKSDLSQMRCSCPKFLSAKLCEHVLVIGSAFGMVSLPQSEWESVQCSSDAKRRRGRRPKVKTVDQQAVESCSDIETYVEGEEFSLQ